MRKRTAKIMTGIGIGMAIGAVSGAVGGSMSHRKTFCGCNPGKTASKAMRSACNAIDNIQSMMK